MITSLFRHTGWLIIHILMLLALAGVITWLAVWVYQLKNDNASRETTLENMYESTIYDSLDTIQSVENNLSKLLVSSSRTESVVIASDIYKDAGAAAAYAGKLPVDQYSNSNLQKFLNQVCDFSGNYLRIAAMGGDLSAYDNQIEELYAVTAQVKQQISSAVSRFGSDYTMLSDIDIGRYTISGGDFESLIEYPSIIYDGPFSDAIEEKVLIAVQNMPEISQEQAKDFLKERLSMTGIRLIGENDKIYDFEGKADGYYAFVSVTKKGGMVLDASFACDSSAVKLTEEDAKSVAVDYARKLGYDSSLTPVWYNALDGQAYINLAPEVNGVIYYPDLVKVKLCLNDGRLLGVDARGYCSNFTNRSVPSVLMDKDAVLWHISPKMKLTNVRTVIIDKYNSEHLCYEAACEYKGLDYFIYVDAVDGKQVDILRVVDDNQGKLVA